jgi:hypothetical protein
VDFVRLHYFDHEHHEKDHDEHENLPFSHHHDLQKFSTSPIVLYFSAIENWFFVGAAEFEKKRFHFEENLPNRSHFYIWRPPRFGV